MRQVVTIAVIALIQAGTASTVVAAEPQAMERDSWTGTIPSGSMVRVVNPHGDVRLRHGGSNGTLEVAAVMQQLATDGSRLALEVAATDTEAVVTVVRLDSEGHPAPGAPRGDVARADLAVLVPEGCPTRAETTFGLIEARGVHVDLDLHTDRGTIRAIKVHGAINAHSNSGLIEVTLEPGVTKKAQAFSSVTGEIVVFSPPTGDLDVTMATSGAFVTDYSLAVEHHDAEEPNKIATATIGAGGVPLIMSSKRGDLALRRVVTAD